MLIHDCKTCERKGNCDLEKMIASLRDTLTAGGIAALVDKVATECAALKTPNERLQWVMSAVEAIGIKSVPSLAEFATGLRDRTPENQKDELTAMMGSALKIISNVVLSKTESLIGDVAHAMLPLASKEDGEGSESVYGTSDALSSMDSPSSLLH